MTYSIVFSSITGNTASLAERVKASLSADKLVYFGSPNEEIPISDLLFVGFWVDKGKPDSASEQFLKEIDNKSIFLFGTAGFSDNNGYYEKLLENAAKCVKPSNKLIGSFICQGKMPDSVMNRYEAMLSANPKDEKIKAMIENFNKAKCHPDSIDLELLAQKVKSTYEKL